VVVPCWRGFLQTFRLSHPLDEALELAVAQVTRVLDEIREAGGNVLTRSAAQVVEDAGSWLERQWDALWGEDDEAEADTSPGLLHDVVVLAKGGLPVYSRWNDHFKPRLEQWDDLVPRDRLHTIRDLLAWLDHPSVAPVIDAAGRRLGLGDQVLDRKRAEVRESALEEAHGLAHGFWYTLYCTVAFQILVVDALYAFHLRAALRPTLWAFTAINLINLALALREAWPWLSLFAQERHALAEIAERLGIKRPLLKASRILFAQFTAALFMAAFMARTALFFDQDRVLPWIYEGVSLLAWPVTVGAQFLRDVFT